MDDKILKQIHLCYYYKEEGESRAEIARILDIPASLVKTRLAQVKYALAKHLLPVKELQKDYPILDDGRDTFVEAQRQADLLREGNTVARNIFRQESLNNELLEQIKVLLPPYIPSDIVPAYCSGFPELWAIVSDAHFGKQTTEFSPGIVKKAVEDFFIKLTLQLQEKGLKHLNLCLLGDILDGYGIYRTQTTEVVMTATEQFTYTLQTLANCIRGILERTDATIDIIGISGNHGRVQTPDIATWENWERLLYQTLEIWFSNELRVNFVLPKKEEFSVIYKRTFLFHGHEIRGGGNLDGIINRVRQWGSLFGEGWDVSANGHFHRSMSANYPINRTHIVNGTAVRGDTFIAALGAAHSNIWWSWVAHHGERTRILELIPNLLYTEG